MAARSRCKAGVVATVVASAISTIIVRSVGVMAPRSRPTFKTINCISPRVFIRTLSTVFHNYDDVFSGHATRPNSFALSLVNRATRSAGVNAH